MSRLSRRTLSTALFALGASAGAPGLALAQAAVENFSLGPRRAKVTVIEYASVTCSHCRNWHLSVFPQFKAKYLDTNKVRFEMRELPTAPADAATAGFMVARCAGQKGEPIYFQVIDALFAGQEDMLASGDAAAWIARAAAAGGMTEGDAAQCLQNEAALKRFNERWQRQIAKDGVTGTPTFFVNGRKTGGDWASLDAAITAALKRR